MLCWPARASDVLIDPLLFNGYEHSLKSPLCSCVSITAFSQLSIPFAERKLASGVENANHRLGLQHAAGCSRKFDLSDLRRTVTGKVGVLGGYLSGLPINQDLGTASFPFQT
jgi:hypothetical protein